jgi:hypothetical protein
LAQPAQRPTAGEIKKEKRGFIHIKRRKNQYASMIRQAQTRNVRARTSHGGANGIADESDGQTRIEIGKAKHREEATKWLVD